MEGSQFQTYDIQTSQLDDILNQQYEALKSRIDQQKEAGFQLIGESIYPLLETGKKLYSGIQTIADQANTAYENLKPLVETPLQTLKSAVEIPQIPQDIEMTTFLEPQLTRLPSSFSEILGQPSIFKYSEPQIMDVQDSILSLDDLGDAFKINQPTSINAQELIMESDPEQLFGETTARIASTSQQFLTSTINDPLTNIANEAVEQYSNIVQSASDTFEGLASNTAEASDVVAGVGEAVGETAAAVGEGIGSALATGGEILAGLSDPILGVGLAIFGLYEGLKNIFDSNPPAPVLAQQIPSLDIGF